MKTSRRERTTCCIALGISALVLPLMTLTACRSPKQTHSSAGSAPMVETAAGLQPHAQTETLERGQDHAVLRTIREIIHPSGQTIYVTNQFTLLENGLHYLENGVWRPSEDNILPFADGAIADRGPNKRSSATNSTPRPSSTFKRPMAAGFEAVCARSS